MTEDYILEVSEKIDVITKKKELYKKQFWLKSTTLDSKRRIVSKKLFLKIDRLHNHIKLWLKYMIKNKPTNYESYVQLIERGKSEMNSSFDQLDKILYKA